MKNNNLPKYEDILNAPAFVVSLERASARYHHTKKLLNDAGFKKIFPFEGLDELKEAGLLNFDSKFFQDPKIEANHIEQ